MELLIDPLFYKAWLTGLCLSLFLPLLGLYLRLRDEWLAALGLAQMSAATGLLGMGLGLPLLVGGPVGGMLMALIKHLTRASNTAYAFMLIAGWSLTFLVAANTTLGESLGHALVEGQLYFVDSSHVIAGVLLLLLGGSLLALIKKPLLRAALFPDFEKLNLPAAWRWHLGFDLLVAIAMGIATACIGLMTAFAMIFIPAWLAFRISANWYQACVIAVLFNGVTFIAGFALAILLNQPYGPCQVATTLAAAAVCSALAQLLKYTKPKKMA